MAEQRYQAVLAVIADGLSVTQVADKVGVSRQSVHSWLARYEAEGLEGLTDRSHRPVSCPHQMPPVVEAALLELRRYSRESPSAYNAPEATPKAEWHGNVLGWT